MNFVNTVKKIRACEGETAAQLVLEQVIEESKKAERNKMWEAVNARVKSGDLGGDGTDKNAERNGLVLATNIIWKHGI